VLLGSALGASLAIERIAHHNEGVARQPARRKRCAVATAHGQAPAASRKAAFAFTGARAPRAYSMSLLRPSLRRCSVSGFSRNPSG
jgi:hypothetical protein